MEHNNTMTISKPKYIRYKCKLCNRSLAPKNFFPSFIKQHRFICKTCYKNDPPYETVKINGITIKRKPIIYGPYLPDDIKCNLPTSNEPDEPTTKLQRCDLCHVPYRFTSENFPKGSTVCSSCIRLLTTNYLKYPEDYPEAYLIFIYNEANQTLSYTPIFPPYNFPPVLIKDVILNEAIKYSKTPSTYQILKTIDRNTFNATIEPSGTHKWTVHLKPIYHI